MPSPSKWMPSPGRPNRAGPPSMRVTSRCVRGVRKFDSDYAQLDQKSRDVIAISNIYYNDGPITVTSDKTLKSNLDTKNSRAGRGRVSGSWLTGARLRRKSHHDQQQPEHHPGGPGTTCPGSGRPGPEGRQHRHRSVRGVRGSLERPASGSMIIRSSISPISTSHQG